MQRRNSIEPPAYDAFHGVNPSYSTLPPDYNQVADDSNSRSTNNSPVTAPISTDPPGYRRHSSSHITYPSTQNDPAPCLDYTTTNQTPSQRRSPPAFGSSYYEPRSQSSDTPRTASAAISSPPKPSLFTRYRAALAEDRERRATRVQHISGTEAQRITGNAARRRAKNLELGRRASFGEEEFSRGPWDDCFEREESEEARRRRKEREKGKGKEKGKDGVLMLFAL